MRDRARTLLSLAAPAVGALLLRGSHPTPVRAASPSPVDTSTVQVLFVGIYHFNLRASENTGEPDVKNVPERELKVVGRRSTREVREAEGRVDRGPTVEVVVFEEAADAGSEPEPERILHGELEAGFP